MMKMVDILYTEHDFILRELDNIAALDSHLDNKDAFINEVRSMIRFFREYADRYHHRKEEEILFPEMVKKQELLGEGVISEMLDNHNDFREMLSEIEEHLSKDDFALVLKRLKIYDTMLRDHIAVENDELFHIADSLFSENEKEMIAHRFEDSDNELGAEEKQNLADHIS